MIPTVPPYFPVQVSYLQVVSLVKNTPVEWPQALVNYFNVVSQVGVGAGCWGWSSSNAGKRGPPAIPLIRSFCVLGTYAVVMQLGRVGGLGWTAVMMRAQARL